MKISPSGPQCRVKQWDEAMLDAWHSAGGTGRRHTTWRQVCSRLSLRLHRQCAPSRPPILSSTPRSTFCVVSPQPKPLQTTMAARCLPAAGCRAAPSRVTPFLSAQKQQASRRLPFRVRSEDVSSSAAAAPASTPAAVAGLYKELDLSLDDYRRAPASVVSAAWEGEPRQALQTLCQSLPRTTPPLLGAATA